MASKEKVCLTTFIYGVSYQAYIPFLVYSCHKSYPDYDIRLYLYDNLDESIKKQLDVIHVPNVVIIEHHFADCPNMTSLKAKSLRWVLWDDIFVDYDYLYIIDIDMLYIKEPTPLHVQHVEHMKTTGLSFDNLVRCFKRHPFRYRSIGYRIKQAGFKSIVKYFFSSTKDYRLTGLHFIETKRYYKLYDKDKILYFKNKIYDGSFLSLFMSSNNESFLYYIAKTSGLGPEKLAIQTESYKMLDFNNYKRPEFRPHHGIHLGIFRQDLESEGKRKTILDSEVYSYYIDAFVKDFLYDPLFCDILENSSDGIKRQFDNLFRYYGIQTGTVKYKLFQ